MKGYSKLETHEPPADDVKKGVAAPSSMTEIPLNDVTAHGEQPIAFPVGTVSVAWKRAFYLLLAAIVLFGAACHLMNGEAGGPHHMHHRKMGPWGHHGHMKGHHDDDHMMDPKFDGDHDDDHMMDPKFDDAKFDGPSSGEGPERRPFFAFAIKAKFDHWKQWAAEKAGKKVEEADDDASDAGKKECKIAFIALKKRCTAAVEAVKDAAEAGKITPAEAEEKIKSIEEGCKARGEALAKKCGGGGGGGGMCKIAFKKLRWGCASALKEVKEAAEAGKITKEQAEKKAAAIKEACKAKAEALKKKCGDEVEDENLDLDTPMREEDI